MVFCVRRNLILKKNQNWGGEGWRGVVRVVFNTKDTTIFVFALFKFLNRTIDATYKSFSLKGRGN